MTKQNKGNYHHVGDLKRIAQAKGWSKQKLKSERGRLLAMTRQEAGVEINRIRKREFGS